MLKTDPNLQPVADDSAAKYADLRDSMQRLLEQMETERLALAPLVETLRGALDLAREALDEATENHRIAEMWHDSVARHAKVFADLEAEQQCAIERLGSRLERMMRQQTLE